MSGIWRLLRTGPERGPWNMALDEALARLAALGSSPPTLRFYAWDPPALSLGYFQSLAEVDLEACRRLGIDVVRRPTGGRAVLHDRELTYALVLPLSYLVTTLPPPDGREAADPLQGTWARASVPESYRALSRGLLLGLQRLGVKAEISRGAGEPRSRGDSTPPLPGTSAPQPFCFLAPARYELHVQGRKIVGSAQRRFHGSLLQHGSILLEFQPEPLCAVLRLRSQEEVLRAKVGSLKGVLGVPPPRSVLEEAILQGFEEAFQIRFEEGAFREEELKLAQELLKTRYASLQDRPSGAFEA